MPNGSGSLSAWNLALHAMSDQREARLPVPLSERHDCQQAEAGAFFSGMPTASASTDVGLMFAAAVPDALCDTGSLSAVSAGEGTARLCGVSADFFVAADAFSASPVKGLRGAVDDATTAAMDGTGKLAEVPEVRVTGTPRGAGDVMICAGAEKLR